MNETKSRKGCNWFYFRIAAASLGIVSGISIFFPFIFVYHNYHAGIWGLVSGVFAAWVLHLHILFLKNKLHKTYTSSKLRFMKLIGGVTSLVTVVFFVTYIVLAAINHQGYAVYGYSYAPAATFTFMTFKWTFMLYWEGGRYQRFLERGPDFTTPLLGNVKIDPKADLRIVTESKGVIESKSSKAMVFNQSDTAEKS